MSHTHHPATAMRRGSLAVFATALLLLGGCNCGNDNPNDVDGGTTTRYAVGGTLAGLVGSGLVLQNSGGDNLPLSGNGTFAFPTQLASGATYAVTVLTQPSSPNQVCTVTAGSGAVANAQVTSVRVDCVTDAFTVGGTVSGLAGTGLVLQNNAGDDASISADGTFTFATPVDSGSTYAVTVLTPPSTPTQVCTVTNGNGTMGTADVTDVTVDCVTSSFTVGGTVSGLSGSGLVLQNNAGDDLSVGADGTFTFGTPLLSGATYDVTVLTQPATPTQTCVVSGATGTVGASNVTSVAVTCTTNTYPVGGTVTGLAGSLVLQNNGADDLTLSADGAFTFTTEVPSGGSYAVTVLTQPAAPSQTCVVASGSGTIGSAGVTSVTVTCTTNSFLVGGTLSGLVAGEAVVLQDNGGDDLTVSANGTFTFATSVLSGAAYAVTVLTHPAAPIAQTCVVASGTGLVGAADVTTVTVTCTTNTYLVGGTVTGLAGSGLVLRNNGADDLSVSADGAFSFATPVLSGATFAVTVFAQPTVPWQTCLVASGAGTVTNANITSVTVTCATNAYNIGGTASGVLGSGLVLQVNGGDDLAVSADGVFTFPTPLASGTTYTVTALTQPSLPTQTCTVSSGGGTIAGADETSVVVTCTTNTYTVGGTVAGLTGTGLVLQNNAGDDLPIAANGPFAFTTPVASGATFAVTVLTQPTTPTQTCVVVGGAGTIGDANITSVTIACDLTWSPALFPIVVAGSTLGLGDMTFDANGDLLLTNSSARTIIRVNRLTGARTTFATGFAGSYLLGITYRAANDMVYASNDAGQIYAVTSTGTVPLLAAYGLLNAIAVAPATFGAYGGFIIGVTNAGAVIAVNPVGGAVTVITAAVGASSDLAFAPDGTLYVCSRTVVRTVTAAGAVATFATGFSSADGIAIAPDGSRMFIADSGPDLVYQVTIPGALRTTIGSYDIDSGFFVGGILADPGNTVIVMTGEASLTLRAFTY